MLETFLSADETFFVLNLLLSLAFGYIIGVERESRGKSAGVGTQCLVIAGSMAFSFISAHVDPYSPSRIASNIVTGIGFLGAGVIFHQMGDKVRNLTTAAVIWMSAGIGMCLGFGYPLIAATLTLFTIVVLRIPHMPLTPGGRRVL